MADHIKDVDPQARIQALENELAELKLAGRGVYFTLASCAHLRGKELFGDQLMTVHTMLDDFRQRIGGADEQQQQEEREPVAQRD